jgi:predicted nucleic-acid-binding protein
VKITADTNLLLRDALQDDLQQARLAAKTLQEAELVAVPVTVLCEFVWVLRQGYKRSVVEIAGAIRRLVRSANVVTNHLAVEAGLEILEKGGDFADGAIAYEGNWLGAEEFVSFDRKAVARLKAFGMQAHLLS